MRIGIVVATAVWLAASSARAATCDESKLARLDKSLTELPGDLHSSMTGAGLVEGCTMPPALASAYKKVLMAGDESFARIGALNVVEADPMLWTRACTGGPRVILEAARRVGDPRVGPREEALALWDGCGVERFGVATRDEWSRAGKGAALAIVTAQWMRETAKLAPARVRTYTRALAGLDLPLKRSLAERYPDDGLGSRGAVSAAPIDVALAEYVGSSDVANDYLTTLNAEGARLAGCLAAFPIPPSLSMRLVIADGVAQEAELLRIRKSGYTTKIDHLDADPRLERCLFARAARIKFKSFAEPTTIDVDVSLKRR